MGLGGRDSVGGDLVPVGLIGSFSTLGLEVLASLYFAPFKLQGPGASSGFSQ